MQQKTVFAEPDKELAFQNICLQVVCNCCAECRKSLCDKGFGILGKDEVASSNPVSYTHLDVYKRQIIHIATKIVCLNE